VTFLRPGLRRALAAASAATLVLALASCGDDETDAVEAGAPQSPSSATAESPSPETTLPATPKPTGKVKPLRAGERRMTLAMPEVYTPKSPDGAGTDDYHCFVLDPKLKKDAFITGTNILPGNPDVVHHVILFKVDPEDVDNVHALDAAEEGQGWTCFGNTGFGNDGPQLDDAPWLGAWAPGGQESVMAAGYGKELRKGSLIVMQVHYNLLKGQEPDISATQLRLMSGNADLTPLRTMLLPGPVELPCRPGHKGPLCDRAAALADVKQRFGQGEGSTADLLYFLCGGKPEPGATQSCIRTIGEPTTLRAVAGHMHLLGQEIKVTVNPGKPDEQVILDIKPWDFDDQTARTIEPISLDWGDQVEVQCNHSQRLRDQLPAFSHAREDRYVLWGEGTTDEMCLGILTVTTP